MSRNSLSTSSINFILVQIDESGQVPVAYLSQPPMSDYFAGLNPARQMIALQYLYNHLAKDGLISETADGNRPYQITARGVQRLQKARLQKATIPRPDSWDGRWRAVIFYMSGQENAKRQAVRLELKRLGLVCIQPGFWIHPFPFEDIANRLATVYGVHTTMAYLEINQTGHDVAWRSHFAELLRTAGG